MTSNAIMVVPAPVQGAPPVAPTVVQSKVNKTAALGTLILTITFDSPVTSGNLLVVGTATYIATPAGGGLTAAMLTKSGGTATIDAGGFVLDVQTGRLDASNHDNRVVLWSVRVTGPGTLTLQLDLTTYESGSGSPTLFGSEVSTADVSGTRLNASSSNNTGTTAAITAGNVATGGAGIIFGVCAPGEPYGSISLTEDGAFTKIDEIEDDSVENFSFIYRTVSTNTTDSADWSAGTSVNSACVGAAYKSSSP